MAAAIGRLRRIAAATGRLLHIAAGVSRAAAGDFAAEAVAVDFMVAVVAVPMEADAARTDD